MTEGIKLPSNLFAGKTAIVTGSSRGVGRATALRLAEGGANVVVNYLSNDGEAAETVRMCLEKGAEAMRVASRKGEEAARGMVSRLKPLTARTS